MSVALATSRRVEFHDTDAAGIMHFSVFFTFMEETEHELLRELGLSVVMHDDGGKISWPRVSASCEFQNAVCFEDVIDIEVVVQRLGERSVTYAFRFLHDDRLVATGSMTSVCCRIVPDLAPQSLPIPEFIAAKLRNVTDV